MKENDMTTTPSTITQLLPSARPTGVKPWDKLRTQTQQEHLAEIRKLAVKKMAGSIRVLVDKPLQSQLEATLGVSVSASVLRELLGVIASGKVELIPRHTTNPAVATHEIPSTPVTPNPHTDMVTIGGCIVHRDTKLTLKQAATALNLPNLSLTSVVNRLRTRCLSKRLAFERDGYTYLVPAHEVARLLVTGL
jgi:hypothetical protein